MVKPLSDLGCEITGCTEGHMTTSTVGQGKHEHRRCFTHTIGGADAHAALAKAHDEDDAAKERA